MSSASFTFSSVAGLAYITDASQTGLDLLGDFTVEFWLRSDNAGEQDIILKRHLSGSLFAYNVFKRNQVDLRIQVSDGSDNIAEVEWAAVFSDDGITWEHFAITCDISQADATKFELYKNGVSQGNGSVITNGSPAAIRNADGSFYIGGDVLHSGGLIADLFSVRVWDDIRSGPEIANNYQLVFENPHTEAGLVGNWYVGGRHHLDRAASTNRNNLTVNDVREVTFIPAQPAVTGPYGEEDGKELTSGPLSDEIPPSSFAFRGLSGKEVEGGPIFDEVPPASFAFRGLNGSEETLGDPVSAGAGNVVTFRMCGHDTVKGHRVFWTSLEVDDDASEYDSPGDIQVGTVRVQKIKGQVVV